MNSWAVDADSYYEVRARNPVELDDVTAAARFLYLNRLCFNGIYRTNRAGKFNVPYGRKTGALPTEAHIYRCSFALRSAELRSVDFEEQLAEAESGDVAYLDPPYSNKPEPSYGLFGYGGFGREDESRVIGTLKGLDARGVRFLFSYADEPGLIERLPEHWKIGQVSVHGHVAANPQRRQNRAEILVTNYPAEVS